jgi:MFS transporter, ACDE family, multidrug resistance protein
MKDMDKKYKLMLLAFSGVPFIMVLGNSMLIPEFPQIKADLNISQFQVGLFITMFSISAGIAIPVLGYLSDQFGRIKIIVPSLLIYGLGGIISGIASLIISNPYYIILIGRVIQGIGAAGTAPIVMALIGDIFQSEQRSEALGIIEAANGFGKVVSPILGSAISLISWIALFFFYAFLSLPIALAVWFLGKEGKKKEKQNIREYSNKITKVFKNKGLSLLSTILAGMLVLFILFGLLSYFSDILETKFKIIGFIKGMVIAIPILFMSITSYINGLLLKKINKYFKASIISGLIIIPSALITLNYQDNLIFYLIFFSVLGIGTGLVLPAVNTLVTSSTKSNQRGGITSLYGGARFIGVAIGPPVFSFLEKYNTITMYFGSSIIAIIILIVGIFLIKEKNMTPDNSNN